MTGKKLHEFTEAEYTLMKRSGEFWELFPNATGNYQFDMKRSREHGDKEQHNRRQDTD